ncbi:MAG: transcriptional regulator [Paenisporosarcina sp.]
MRKEIIKYLSYGTPVYIIYIAISGKISKRRVCIRKVKGDVFEAYCYTRNAQRNFKIENVLAISPVQTKERKII